MAPINIRKHDRLHGAKPSLNISPPFCFSYPKLRQTTKSVGLKALGRLTADVHKLVANKHAPSVQGFNQTAEKSS